MSEGSDADTNALLGQALAYADKLLRGNEQFFPFGIELNNDGTLSIVQTVSLSEGANAPELVATLRDGFRQKAIAQELRACAVCWDANVERAGKKNSDAVAVAVEHRDAPALTFYLPCGRGFLGRLAYVETASFSVHEDATVFLGA